MKRNHYDSELVLNNDLCSGSSAIRLASGKIMTKTINKCTRYKFAIFSLVTEKSLARGLCLCEVFLKNCFKFVCETF